MHVYHPTVMQQTVCVHLYSVKGVQPGQTQGAVVQYGDPDLPARRPLVKHLSMSHSLYNLLDTVHM